MTVPMKKWFLYAAADGLFLRQGGAKSRSDGGDIHIEYRTLRISSSSQAGYLEETSKYLEIYGVVGILNLVSSYHLIVITRREQVAQIRSKAIYALRDVALIPLSSQTEANKIISNTSASVQQQQSAGIDTDGEPSDDNEDAETSSIGGNDAPKEAAAVDPPKAVLAKGTSFTKNVIQDRGRYGRFATKWFTKNGSNANVRRKQGLSSEESLTPSQPEQKLDEVSQGVDTAATDPKSNANDAQVDQATPPGEPSKNTNAIETLSRRIERTARLYFSSGGFYFSYDLDLSRRFSVHSTTISDSALWKRFDPEYLWNANLAAAFIDTGRDDILLPLMQGFVGQRAVYIARTDGDQNDSVKDTAVNTTSSAPEQPSAPNEEGSSTSSQTQDFLLTLISRRSIKRAGLRYLRRGVDDEGNVANGVETEQILSSNSWNTSEKVFSLTQTRGSIPLHFTQSPYSFKPTPVIHGSEATNQTALRRHFELLSLRYNQVQAVSLVDKHGPENGIGQQYENHIKKLNENNGIDTKAIAFEWFDFHAECKGMKFENVSILIASLEERLKSFAWTVERDSRVIQQQAGILRTNCMDCLDRTNVVQSAVAGWALEHQLFDLGIQIDLKTDPKTQWFNALWADNGDAISKQYAGTAALKGDFTRTRKRNWTGALSDFSLTLNRYYNNIFGDYFLQTCIDFFLGNAGPAVFDDFETDMMAKDYALDMNRIRQNAVDTCIKIALEDPDEDLIDGWVLSCPQQANTLRSLPFEECVVLLTAFAFYFCRFDWTTEKVASFEKVILSDISEIWRGAYITNAFGTNLDETKNVGFALRYKPAENFMVRRNTRTLRSDEGESEEHADESQVEKREQQPEKDRSRLLAFKALPANSAGMKKTGNTESTDEIEVVRRICDKLHAATESLLGNSDLAIDRVPKVEERDIISAAEAKKNTGYAESIGYSLKKLVWS